MKKVILFVIIVMFSLPSVIAQSNHVIKNPVGIWKFDAPYAPEGYTSGSIAIGLEENKYNTSMSFTGSDYKLPGEKVKVTGDSITFSIFLEGQDITVLLKKEEATKMTGKAIYSEGEVPLTLTKNTDPAQEIKK